MSDESSKAPYSRPPITEAIIDLRVDPPEGFDASSLRKISQRLGESYSKVEAINAATGQIQLVPEIRASASSTHIGYSFHSHDGVYVCRTRTNGFTMSHLSPYDKWDAFREETRRISNFYRDQTNPVRINRVAVRYINRIDIPLPLVDFKDYLLTVPEIAPKLPQGLTGFFLQLSIPFPDIVSTAIINETIVEPHRSDIVSVVLDIDIFRTSALPTAYSYAS